MKKKPFNINKSLIVIFIITVVLILIFKNYKYNKCITVNNEELKKCLIGDYGNYDCSVFENAKEICSLQ